MLYECSYQNYSEIVLASLYANAIVHYTFEELFTEWKKKRKMKRWKGTMGRRNNEKKYGFENHFVHFMLTYFFLYLEQNKNKISDLKKKVFENKNVLLI